MDARDIIFSELSEKVHGEKKVTGDAYMICCPFHGDTNPSLGINLAVDSNIPLGYFHCFGCSAKGNWNGLAEKLGLEQIKDWQLGFVGHSTKLAQRKRKPVLYLDVKEKLENSIYTKEAIPWPKGVRWRGYQGNLLSKLGAIYYNDKLTQQLMVFFPIYVKGKYRGGVRAYMEKQVDGNSYLTTKGNWVKDYGLLAYEYVKKIVRKYQYDAVVLVEGPRDALRLLANNIPALAILGSKSVSDRKMLTVTSLSSKIKTVYVLPDNDNAGKQMYERVKHFAGDYVKVRHLRLPKPKKNGKLIKLDPDNVDQEIIDEIRVMFRRHKKAA